MVLRALSLLQQNGDVGLVFADWHMPNMDGFTMLQEIKSNPQTKAIPVVMVTTQAEKQSVMDALKTGASNYIVKPFTPDIIKEKIAEVLG